MNLTLQKPVYGGDCLTHLPPNGGKPGKAVFVPLTLPGETIEAQIVEEKRNHIQAEANAILTASPDRVAPGCPHYGQCGGCQYQHANYPAQLAFKQQILRETLQRAHVPLPAEIAILAADPWHYRNRIRLAVTPSGEIGYRSRGSHQIVPIRECPIAAPLLAEIALDFGSFLEEATTQDSISEIELFTNQDDSELSLTLFFETAEPQSRGLRLTRSADATRFKLERTEERFLTYGVAGFNYRVSHGAFFQVNRHLLDRFAEHVTANQSGSLAWDLYAGVGLFARRLAASFSQVHAVESAPAAVESLRENLRETGSQVANSTTLDFLRNNRENREPRPDLIVLDPPRAGLGDQVTTLLNAVGAPSLVYVSCDPTTLARDLRALTQERYRIDSVTLVDMFPQTFHMETVVKLRRF